MPRFLQTIFLLIAVVFFIGCGGGGSSNSNGYSLAYFTIEEDDGIFIREGQSKIIALQGIYEDGSYGTLNGNEAEYQIENTSIASVDFSGKIKALKEGNTFLVIKYPAVNSIAVNVIVSKELNVSNLNTAYFGNTYISSAPQDATIEKYDERLFAMLTGKVLDERKEPIENVIVSIK